ncbi:MAG: hypothetical protein IJ936_07375, partial [Peptococcaceae bacterium]|nr:hypothetical protein [Peptococcaceae bacterium]
GADVELAVTSGSELGYYFFMLDKEGDVVGKLPLNAEAAQEMTLDTTNYAGGTYDVYAVAADTQVATVLNSAARYADKVEALFGDHGQYVLDSVALKVRNAENVYAISFVEGTEVIDGVDTVSISANNGFNGGLVTAKVVKNETTNVKDAKLSFSTVGFVTVTPVDQVTGRDGEAQFKVSATKAGNYKVYVTYGDCTKVLNVAVDPVSVANVEVVKAPKAPIALDSEIDAANVKFKFTDANGAAYTNMTRTQNYNLTLVAKPADSSLETGDVALDADFDLIGVDGAIFDEEGDYTFRVSLQNGNAATATVSVKEFDKTVAIQFVDTLAKSVVYESNTFAVDSDDIVCVDANGVTKAVEGTVSFSVSGKAVESFTDENVLTVKDEDYIGQTITVYAVYTEDGKTFTASHNLVVIDDAAEIVYAATEAEVAVNNVLYATVVDANGNKVDLEGEAIQAVVLDKPENAIAVATTETELDNQKRVVLNLLVSAAGEYKVQTIIKTGDNKYISSIDTFTVGATKGEFKDIVVVSLGADKMIVNSEVVALDVAPFIENNRTMMQFNVLYVFGIDVEWVAETQSIVAEGNGLKVVMQLGSKVATVNGEEVALDVAPYTVNGRTVVPVGFITGLLDITPTFTYNADGTIADILFTK